LEIIGNTSLLGVKLMDFPMEQHHKLALTFDIPLEDPEPH